MPTVKVIFQRNRPSIGSWKKKGGYLGSHTDTGNLNLHNVPRQGGNDCGWGSKIMWNSDTTAHFVDRLVMPKGKKHAGLIAYKLSMKKKSKREVTNGWDFKKRKKSLNKPPQQSWNEARPTKNTRINSKNLGNMVLGAPFKLLCGKTITIKWSDEIWGNKVKAASSIK